MRYIILNSTACLYLCLSIVVSVHAHDGSEHAEAATPAISGRALELLPTADSVVAGMPDVAFDRMILDINPENYSFGRWSEVVDWPVLAVHANLLPTGSVLAWDATPDDFDDDPHTAENYTTRVTVWDPTDGSHLSANNDTDADLFCAGSAQLWDGRVVFAGGDSGRAGRNGPLANSSMYDPWTNTWVRMDNMEAPRWYSSVAAMASGELLTFGGSYTPTPIAEVLRLNKQWRALDIATPYTFSGDYQWLQADLDGGAMYLGPHNLLGSLDATGDGQFELLGERDDESYRGYGSYAMYTTGKVLVAGGGASSDSAVIVDMTTKSSVPAAPLGQGRRQHNLTILADGTVLATGGNSSAADLLDLANGVLTPERWNPATAVWSPMADMHVDRQYHSVALLLPDGSVLSAGGGYCAVCGEVGYHEQNAEIFMPPYLFDDDGRLAARPVIEAAPAVINYEVPFTVQTGEATDIQSVHLIKLGSVTHSQNQEQRLVPLEFSSALGRLIVDAPDSRNTAPPGHYMLIIVDVKGVPSTSAIVQVGQPLIKSNDVIVNTVRENHWDYYAIEGKDEHALTVNLRGDVEDVDLFVNSDRLPTGPDDGNGFYDCLSSGSQDAGKLCIVSAEQDTTWYIGVYGNQRADYSLIAHLDEPDIVQQLPVGPTQPGAPSAPLNLRVQILGQFAVELFWDASTDLDGTITGYEIYRDGELEQFTTGTSHSMSSLVPGTRYQFQIVSVDNAQNRSARSLPFVVNTQVDDRDLDTYYNPEIPTAPTGVRSVVYSATAGEIFWEKSIDNGYITGYEIYRNDVLLDFIDASSYYDGSIVPGVVYEYFVIAVDNERNGSVQSNTALINLPAPTTPPEEAEGGDTVAGDFSSTPFELDTSGSDTSESSISSSGSMSLVLLSILASIPLMRKRRYFQRSSNA